MAGDGIARFLFFRNPVRHTPHIQPAQVVVVKEEANDTTFQERVTRLEARLADTTPSADAHSTALYSGIRSLVTELIRRRRQSEQLCETLTRVLEATSDGFVALDFQWRYTYVNAHAGQMLGRDPQSLIGKNIWAEFPEGVGQPFQQEYERAMAEGNRIRSKPTTRRTIAGSRIAFSVRRRARDLLPGCHRATCCRRAAARE
jgi:PAS domain S-box-containing protein